MDRETREQLARNFDASGNDPRTWLVVAANLRTAALILEPHFPLDFRKEPSIDRVAVGARLQGPILMLRGCELKCLLKAIYVAVGNELAKGGAYKAPRGKPHDLVALARAADLSASPEDVALLSYLGYYISGGRYPIGTRAPQSFHLRADGKPRDRVWGEEEDAEYQAFRKRVRKQAEEAAKNWQNRGAE
jgi:hypothetical protein